MYLADRLSDPSFERKPVRFALEIGAGGRFLGIRERVVEVARGKKTALQVLELAVPKSPVNRNTGVHPLLGCDAIQYVVGSGPWTKEGDKGKHDSHHEAFVARIRVAAERTGEKALKACSEFYDDPERVAAARNSLAQAKAKPSDHVALAFGAPNPEAPPPVPVIELPRVRELWREHYKRAYGERLEAGGKGMCLVCGREGPVAPTHDKIKGVARLGGRAEVALMSFDKMAFQSYGWPQNVNSPVSPDCAAAYVLALNDLLRPGEHRRGATASKVVRTRFDVAKTAFLFWTRSPSDDDWYALLHEAQPEQVHQLLGAPFSGFEPPEVRQNEFFMVAICGNGARLVIRHWFHDSLTAVRRNIRSWFASLQMANALGGGVAADPPKLWQLLAALVPTSRGSPLERSDQAPADSAVQLVRRALQGLPVGRTVLAAALRRLRAQQGSTRLDPGRLGLVRLCVNDLAKLEKKGDPIMPDTLDPALEHPAYICGRMMALYDGLQYAAQGELNVTVVDRYYALASMNPSLAFPHIEELGFRHLKKLRRDNPGAAVAIQRELQTLHEILARNGARFPGQLGLEDQGRFAIGFHHQKADTARRIREAKERRAAAVQEQPAG
jgi:CRISPR-associated protein Csd1